MKFWNNPIFPAAMLCCIISAWGEACLLRAVHIPESANLRKLEIVLSFTGRAPEIYPVYQAKDPLRIVVDLPDTRMAGENLQGKTEVDFVTGYSARSGKIGGKPVTRVEIYIRERAAFSVEKVDRDLVLSLSAQSLGPNANELISGEDVVPGAITLTDVKYSMGPLFFDLEIEMSGAPEAPLVYEMGGPARILVDLNNVVSSRSLKQKIEGTPVTEVNVLAADNGEKFTAVSLLLKQACTFNYRLQGEKITLHVEAAGEDWKAVKKWVYIGSGILLGAGITTGIILSDIGGGDSPGEKPADLGKPPDLPDVD